jgi:hypothetical protein
MTSDGCGGDGGHCGSHGGIGGTDGGAGLGLPADVAVPKLARLEINGAPVTEQSHEYVIRKSEPDAQD